MRTRFWLIFMSAVVGCLAGRLTDWFFSQDRDSQSSIPARAVAAIPALVPDASVPDLHHEAFMVQDRAGHITSSRIWRFEDDWFADGGKLGCRRFSTDGATLEFCLDPYHTGSGCPVVEGPVIHHTLR